MRKFMKMLLVKRLESSFFSYETIKRSMDWLNAKKLLSNLLTKRIFINLL
jgi:hypothetical protein